MNVGRGSGMTDRCVKVGIIYKCECRAGFRDDGQVCEGRYYIQNADCFPEGDSYRCECRAGFRGV